MSKKYIGVDLGAWYGNKTRIAILEENEDGSLNLLSIKREEMKEPLERNERLVQSLLKEADNNAIIGIDAPFAIPYYLYNPLETKDISEELYNPDKLTGELANQFIYDNSARFVKKITDEKALAPAGDKIGKMTARMVQIVGKYKAKLNIIRSPKLDENTNTISTIEVYPRATLQQITNKKVPQYKNKKSDDYFKTEYGRKEMFKILENFNIKISTDIGREITSDDDYDAIICALTTYLTDKNGYEKPDNEDLDKFTNSFIYIPKVKNQND